MIDKLSNYIKSYVDIQEEELAIILSCFEKREILKDKFALKRGQVVTDYYFIHSGGFIIYDVDDDIQSTRYFAFENEFITDISKIKSRQRTASYIRAIEDTVVYTITHQKMETLYNRFHIWEKFGRLIWENSFMSVLRAIHDFQSLNAKERYLALLKRSDLIQRVPLKDLSLFLGITPSSLSRIRKEII
ncbi:Crp/Fnr family transcriptional regulator [Aquimarina sp. I32.4]|uniref:Crp/Fnr family transcriptional regulator n=1 Tax=Aquimarina sp. I32.4 TaxID=2053903 RepID=UPI000CDE8242|nr:Crp/Fnr family transcriptional regulator [Aquimarina sp. I32.4]